MVRVVRRSVGGVGLPRPDEASAGKSGWNPSVRLPINNAAYGLPGRGAPARAGLVWPGLLPVLVTGGAVMTPAAFAVKFPKARSTVPIASTEMMSLRPKFPDTVKLGPEKTSVPLTVVVGTLS